jgi:hypothetical protein
MTGTFWKLLVSGEFEQAFNGIYAAGFFAPN